MLTIRVLGYLNHTDRPCFYASCSVPTSTKRDPLPVEITFIVNQARLNMPIREVLEFQFYFVYRVFVT